MHPKPPTTLPSTTTVATEAAAQPQLVERRRPGRVEYTNPHLIALLRYRAQGEPVEKPDPSVAGQAVKSTLSATTDSPALAEVRAMLNRLNAAWWTLDRISSQWELPQRQPVPVELAVCSPHQVKEPNAAHADTRGPSYDFPEPAFTELPAAKPRTEAPDQEGNPGQFSAARGIGIGLLIAAPIWAGIVAFGWWLIDR